MMLAEVAGLEGVGGEVSGLIQVWKCVEKSEMNPQETWLRDLVIRRCAGAICEAACDPVVKGIRA